MRYLLVAVFALVGVQNTAAAQYLPPCDTCHLEGWVDLPRAGNAALGWREPVQYGKWEIAGWAFRCYDGKIPDRYEVWYTDDRGYAIPVKGTTYTNQLWRPDVLDHFVNYFSPCATPINSGYHIQFSKPIPRGTRHVYVIVRMGGLMISRDFWVTIQ